MISASFYSFLMLLRTLLMSILCVIESWLTSVTFELMEELLLDFLSETCPFDLAYESIETSKIFFLSSQFMML